MDNASNMANNEMPKSFTEKMEFMDWKPTLVNFLKSQPGRNGVPLNCVVRDNEATIIRPNANFLYKYVDRKFFIGIDLSYDFSKLH